MFTSKPQDWEQTRQQKQTAFVWKFGVGIFGLPTAVLWSLVMHYREGADLRIVLPIALVLFPIGGYFYGRIMWWFNESICARYQLGKKSKLS